MSSAKRAEILLLGVAFVAAAGWVFTKLALVEFTPFLFMGLRFLLASAALAFMCWGTLVKLSAVQWRQSIFAGLLMAVALLIWIKAVELTPFIGEGAFIISLSVVVVPIIGRLFFNNKISARLLLALVPAMAGLAMLSLSNGLHLESYQLLFLCSLIAFSFHLNLSNIYVKEIPIIPLATIQLFVVGLLNIIMAFFFESMPGEISMISWFWLLCSGLIATSLRFVMQLHALKSVQASHAAMLLLLEPVLTTTLGAIVLSEHMSLIQLMGCLLIFASLLFYQVAPRLKQWLRFK